jgi:hypothetical protein
MTETSSPNLAESSLRQIGLADGTAALEFFNFCLIGEEK